MTQFTEPQMRPPQEAHSLLLRATQGCTYNKCSFCYVSRGYPFMAVTDTELSLEAERARPFFSPDTPIYLTGSNPLALPFARLASWIAVLRTSFPHFSRLSIQARIGDIALKSDGELSMLARLGLNHLYIGTENGNNMVLSLMNKGHTAEDIVRELTRLDGAGITYTNFYILGMGGKGRGIESGLATARMFNRVHPKRITTTGLTIFPDIHRSQRAGKDRGAARLFERTRCRHLLRRDPLPQSPELSPAGAGWGSKEGGLAGNRRDPFHHVRRGA